MVWFYSPHSQIGSNFHFFADWVLGCFPRAHKDNSVLWKGISRELNPGGLFSRLYLLVGCTNFASSSRSHSISFYSAQGIVTQPIRILLPQIQMKNHKANLQKKEAEASKRLLAPSLRVPLDRMDLQNKCSIVISDQLKWEAGRISTRHKLYKDKKTQAFPVLTSC